MRLTSSHQTNFQNGTNSIEETVQSRIVSLLIKRTKSTLNHVVPRQTQSSLSEFALHCLFVYKSFCFAKQSNNNSVNGVRDMDNFSQNLPKNKSAAFLVWRRPNVVQARKFFVHLTYFCQHTLIHYNLIDMLPNSWRKCGSIVQTQLINSIVNV